MEKKKTPRDERYLRWLRQRPCCVSRQTEGVVAHHVRLGTGGGVGLKPSDYYCVPLTQSLHQSLHQGGERSFWMKFNLDPWQVMAQNLMCFLAENYETGVTWQNDAPWVARVRWLEQRVLEKRNSEQ